MKSDLIGRGWTFPVKTDSNGRMRFLGGVEKINQSIWLILSTAVGEREMLPEFGCGIHDLVFEANSAGLRFSIQEKVKEALARWEPRIENVEVRVETPPDEPSHLMIEIEYKLENNNAVYNLVYPFFIDEGPA